MDKNAFKIELPNSIGNKITFKVENSPTRHGKIIDFVTRSEGNTVSVVGYKVKCKNSSTRIVYFDEVIKKILFVGLSDKVGCMPLQSGTISGDLVDRIIAGINGECHKINLVNFAPLDENGKLRYPTKSEMDIGYRHLQELIKELNPDICVLLGNKVSKYLSNKVTSLSIQHPSYISVYRRKSIDEYINDSINLVNSAIHPADIS